MQSRDENAVYLQPKRPSRWLAWLKWTFIGCGGMAVLALGSCTAGAWYLAYQGKKAFEEFNASRENARATLQSQKDPEKIPDWVPIHPGSVPENAFFSSKDDTGSGFFRLKVPGGASAAAQFFRQALAANGFAVDEHTSAGQSGPAVQLVARQAGDSRLLSISLSTQPGEANAIVRYLW